ncbi:MAG TPA: hypothetical protein PKA63_06895 [Oligoflexia bacterium]|nr:hypothetical protein [Oligoflexia bacterium]HMP48377.1 hypothetical protein [Oligoflexia bacterium]
MTTVYINNSPVSLDPNDPWGEGGECKVFLVNGKIIKIYRGKNDPIYLSPGDPEQTRRNQLGALRRLKVHQQKLPAFPSGLPDKVVSPSTLVYSAPNGATKGGKPVKRWIIGYEMPLIKGNIMADYADIAFREANSIDNNMVRDIHLDWLGTIEECHPRGLVFGDVNNNNQIVTADGKVYIIDADAAQWSDSKGKIFHCETFTPRFVDPLICESGKLVMTKPHSIETDLYSFALIYWLTTLYIGPWDGVLPLKTKDLKAQGVRPNERALKRISVMHPEVRYPKWATHFSMLPDDMLEFYDALLHKDVRGKSMRKLLENIRWTKCSSCGTYHARPKCPSCAAPSPSAITVTKITRSFEVDLVLDLGSAKILSTSFQNGKLCYLFHKDKEFHREFGPIGLHREIDKDLDTAISGDRTAISMNGNTFKFAPGEKPERISAEKFRGRSPQFGGNSEDIFYLRSGQLIKESSSVEGKYMGETLPNQTLLWVGENLGLAFYYVSGLQKLKVFSTNGEGLVNVNNMPGLRGTLRHASAYFSKTRAWLFVTTDEKSVLYNTCFVIKANGECVSSLSVEQGDPDHPWLSGFIHLGKCAAQVKGSKGQRIECLLAATDNALIRIMDQGGKLLEAFKFEVASGEVLPTDRLLYEDVLYRIRGGQIHTVRTK